MRNTIKGEAGWYYWEAGILASLLAMALAPPDTPAHLAFGLLTILFLYGIAQGSPMAISSKARKHLPSDVRRQLNAS